MCACVCGTLVNFNCGIFSYVKGSLENAMGAAGVVVKKELTKSVGADTAVQNAYTERVRKCGRSGLDMHPDFCPDRYPNASKFFYNRPN